MWNMCHVWFCLCVFSHPLQINNACLLCCLLLPLEVEPSVKKININLMIDSSVWVISQAKIPNILFFFSFLSYMTLNWTSVGFGQVGLIKQTNWITGEWHLFIFSVHRSNNWSIMKKKKKTLVTALVHSIQDTHTGVQNQQTTTSYVISFQHNNN